MTSRLPNAPSAPDIDAPMVLDILRQVIDPELGMNIVALGLIYHVDISTDRVLIEMTMTSPACPMGDMILDDVNKVLTDALPGRRIPEIHLIWNPPWDPSMMDQSAKLHFGWAPD